MTEYKTVEGHPIVRDGVYETRRGDKAVVVGFHPDRSSVLGYVKGKSDHRWSASGESSVPGADPYYHSHALMRPWKEEPSEDEALDRDFIKNNPMLYTRMKDGTYANHYLSEELERLDECLLKSDDEEAEDKKVYKLSEMWKGWYRHECGVCVDVFYYETVKQAYDNEGNEQGWPVVAITRADATEFYEGEGLYD